MQMTWFAQREKKWITPRTYLGKLKIGTYARCHTLFVFIMNYGVFCDASKMFHSSIVFNIFFCSFFSLYSRFGSDFSRSFVVIILQCWNVAFVEKLYSWVRVKCCSFIFWSTGSIQQQLPLRNSKIVVIVNWFAFWQIKVCSAACGGNQR